MRRKLLKWTAITLGALVALVGALLLAFQIAVSRVPEYQAQLQEWLNDKTKMSVEVTKLNARLRMFGPELVFADVTVRTPDRVRVLATARGGSIAFDWWKSLRTGRLIAGRFSLDSPQLGLIRTRDGRIQMAGQSAQPEDPQPFALENLPIGKFDVRDAVVTFQDEASGRGPWSVSGVSFVLTREPDLLKLDGDASLPTALGGLLEFQARVVGELEASHQVVSTFSVRGEALDLTGWSDFMPERWSGPESGRGSIELSAAFSGPELQSAVVKATFADVKASRPVWSLPIPTAAPLRVGARRGEGHEEAASPSPDSLAVEAATVELPTPETERSHEPAMLHYERVNLDARLARDQQGWHATISDLELKPAGSAENASDHWRSKAIDVRWTRSAEGAFEIAGNVDYATLQGIAPLLAYLPESRALAHVRGMELRGTVRDIEFQASRTVPDEPTRFSFSAATDDIGFSPVRKVPGFTGLSGTVRATERGGEYKLDSGPIVVSLPWMFRWPLDTNAMRATLTWRNDADGWHIETSDLQFQANDGSGEAKLAVLVPHDGSSPQLDISAQARDMNAAATPKYLPANTLGPEALAWLDRAFVSGRVPRGSLELHGPTRSFPFRGGGGLFLVKGEVEDITFDYQPGWTPATQLTGEVEFRNEGMLASNVTAHVGDLAVTQATGKFGDFKKGDLTIEAAATGDLGSGLAFLQTSPIGAVLGEQFKALQGTGSIESGVKLFLPIFQVDARKLAVTTKLTDSTVTMKGLDAPLTALSGSLIVRQSLPVEADLTGAFLGGPVHVTITPQDRTDELAMLVAQGTAKADKLAAFAPPIVKINGELPWRMNTLLSSRADRHAQQYTIESDTVGFGVDMPYPAGKSSETPRPLRVELEQGNKQVLARAAFGSMRGLLRIAQQRGEWVFDRGGVRADGVAVALPDHPGLRLEGAIDRLRLDDWLALSGNDGEAHAASSAPANKVSDVLRAANLHIGVLELYGYEWPDVRGLLQATGKGWRIDVNGENAEGQLFVPETMTGADPLTIDFERLIVTRSELPEGGVPRTETSSRDPREWPSLHVHIGDMHVENHPIGGVDLVAKRVADGLRIESLAIAQDAVQAEAKGAWLMGPAGEHSNLQARITSTDVRATLKALNYTEFLQAKRAEVSGQLSWPGGFDGNLVRRASGTITVSAEAGQLLTLQPGAGRVLGLFSVAALPRRLALDFSDITEKGLSFDTIHGDFELREGNAYTSNLLLRGPAAEIGVAGRTGLATQDYDQTAVVTGNLGASIPVAGALAGGPAIGAALLLFSQVFKEPLKGIARGYYKIKGSWNDPIVERVDAAEAKETAVQVPKVDG